MNLYLKYRPKSLDKLYGNEELISTIKGLLEEPAATPHTMLLHGPTGSGKTTIARIIANELECVDSDLVEIDSAQFRGIDTVRELRKNIQYKAIHGKVRVYIIDEVHSATKDAQNAMLKIFEDTPDHVYFILCTTDPQKLLPTIRGRCIELKVATLSDNDMEALLKKITKKEKDKLDKKIISQIIQDSQGHPRNALQILQKVLSTDKNKRLEVAQQSAEEQSKAIELCRALIKGEGWVTVRKILKDLKGQDNEGIRRMVQGYATSVLLNGVNNKAALILEEFSEPTYSNGFNQIVYASYAVTMDE